MKPLDLNSRIIDSYLELLSNLSVAAKRDLIAKLTKSVKQNIKPKKHTFEEAFGAWDPTDSTESLIKSIRTSRRFSRKIADM